MVVPSTLLSINSIQLTADIIILSNTNLVQYKDSFTKPKNSIQYIYLQNSKAK